MLEAPRFEFIEFIDVTLPKRIERCTLFIDESYLATLDEKYGIEIRSVYPQEIRASLSGRVITLQAAPARKHRAVRVQLAGIAKGHGARFPQFNDGQRETNARLWASALFPSNKR